MGAAAEQGLACAAAKPDARRSSKAQRGQHTGGAKAAAWAGRGPKWSGRDRCTAQRKDSVVQILSVEVEYE